MLSFSRNFKILSFTLLMASVLLAFQNCSSGQQDPRINLPPDGPDPKPPVTGPAPMAKSDAQVRQEFAAAYPASWLDMPVGQIAADSFSVVPGKAIASYLPIEGTINPNKGKLLSIGDSISLCYFPYLRKETANDYNVYRVPHNGASTEKGLQWIDTYLEFGPFDTIVVNWGIHDSTAFKRVGETEPYTYKTNELDYKNRLRSMLGKMKATGAQVVFVLSTKTLDPEAAPVNGVIKGTWNEGVIKHNMWAREVLAELGIPAIDPLDPAFHPTQPVFSSDKLHFEAETCQSLGLSVARQLRQIGRLPLTRAFYKIGAWSTCLNGSQRRSVTCSDFSGKTLAASTCNIPSLGPVATTQTCEPIAYRWIPLAWGKCVNSVQTRQTRCIDERGVRVDLKNCVSALEPIKSQACTP